MRGFCSILGMDSLKVLSVLVTMVTLAGGGVLSTGRSRGFSISGDNDKAAMHGDIAEYWGQDRNGDGANWLKPVGSSVPADKLKPVGSSVSADKLKPVGSSVLNLVGSIVPANKLEPVDSILPANSPVVKRSGADVKSSLKRIYRSTNGQSSSLQSSESALETADYQYGYDYNELYGYYGYVYWDFMDSLDMKMMQDLREALISHNVLKASGNDTSNSSEEELQFSSADEQWYIHAIYNMVVCIIVMLTACIAALVGMYVIRKHKLTRHRYLTRHSTPYYLLGDPRRVVEHV